MVVDISIFKGGEHKLVLPPIIYTTIEFLLLFLLAYILHTPTSKLASSTKQTLSIPLVIMLLMYPSGFAVGNKLVEFSTPTVNFVAFLKCVDLFWVIPITKKTPVHTTTKQLLIDMFDFLYNFTSDKKDKTTKKKKTWHLVFYVTAYWLAMDLLVNWFTTFSGREVVVMRNERPFLFFIYFAVVGTVMHCCFNMVGYTIQLIHCIATAKTSYSPETWNTISEFPLFSRNLTDLWTNRWHKMFKKTWLSFPFKPVYHLSQQYMPKAISYLFASLSVFFISGIMHEYIIAVNVGWPFYWHYLKGEQVTFFMLQGLGIALEQLVLLVHNRGLLPAPFRKNAELYSSIIQRVWGLWFVYSTFIYFVHGFAVKDFQLDHSVRFTASYLKNILLAHPKLESYFGSHI